MSQQTFIQPGEFLERAQHHPVIDVRSPAEFSQGHIPGAINIPLFDNEERAIVGTTYTHSGNRQAVLKGLELAGPKLREYVRKADMTGHGGELLVHCWRGGMRSEAMAWLFNFSGITTRVLDGGYKAYRRHIREALGAGPELMVLSGMTGSGKTEVLNEMASQGCQVIDLEKLAHHKGSAFGALGQTSQPTTEQFENELAAEWLAMGPQYPVWVEDESLNIGKVIIPDPFYSKMMQAPMVYLDVPFELRVSRLMREYGHFSVEELSPDIVKISKRMGGEKARLAIGYLKEGNLRQAISLVLAYYDKAYQYSYEKKKDQTVRLVPIHHEQEIKSVASGLRTNR